MTMSKWARREVECAKKKHKDDNYGNDCRESALKAYESLMEDGHSGFSFKVTKGMLERLLNGMPLTEITNMSDFDENGQCTRMPSLFMKRKNGHVTFTQNKRAIAKMPDGKEFQGGALADTIVDTIWPIGLPYFPSVRQYEAYLSKDAKARCVITPQGECYMAGELAAMFAEAKWLRGAKTMPDMATMKAVLESMFDTSVSIGRKVNIHENEKDDGERVYVVFIGELFRSRIEILERDGELIGYDVKGR